MQEEPLVTNLNPHTLTPQPIKMTPPTNNQTAKFFLYLLVIVAGLISGYFLANRSNNSTNTVSTTAGKDVINTSNEVGSTDTSTFKDQATGTLEAGGIQGEGTHKLTREGGTSQTVYLVSSVVDLDAYVGKKVQVWGQTLKAKHAGWLMDVGRLKILE